MLMITKSGLCAAAILVFGAPAIVAAQQPASIVAGMQVKDPAGGLVGTVTSFDGESVMVRTDRHSAQIAKTAFTPDKGMLLLGMTQVQLDTAIDRSLADAAAKLVSGAAVVGSQGAPVGTIETIDAQFPTLKLTSGKMIKIARDGLAVGANGPSIAMTAGALELAAAAATAAPVKP
ncbi:hypothetical protein [Sphingomonas sp. 10B4]|uniref:hypothetical protein n=1 Tax=Sphingomonas sp. 10B4 TaxID=3048575 RepID=UPI002AB44400|nr:hypothetical protein [Sphingomonas sp. 10B4]MDY7524624.1 hypothetical protein [Sphingomonas sp. 10B4]MEB0282420.1 hypothetical protein [Sphingomonas sp. 10B4]